MSVNTYYPRNSPITPNTTTSTEPTNKKRNYSTFASPLNNVDTTKYTSVFSLLNNDVENVLPPQTEAINAPIPVPNHLAIVSLLNPIEQSASLSHTHPVNHQISQPQLTTNTTSISSNSNNYNLNSSNIKKTDHWEIVYQENIHIIDPNFSPQIRIKRAHTVSSEKKDVHELFTHSRKAVVATSASCNSAERVYRFCLQNPYALYANFPDVQRLKIKVTVQELVGTTNNVPLWKKVTPAKFCTSCHHDITVEVPKPRENQQDRLFEIKNLGFPTLSSEARYQITDKSTNNYNMRIKIVIFHKKTKFLKMCSLPFAVVSRLD